MMQINERHFESFTIVGAGWTYVESNYKKALRTYSEMNYGRLLGRKHNGDIVEIDCKD